MQLRILNEEEIKEFNKDFNVDFKSVMIKQENDKFYAILDLDLKIKIYKSEAMKYSGLN